MLWTWIKSWLQLILGPEGMAFLLTNRFDILIGHVIRSDLTWTFSRDYMNVIACLKKKYAWKRLWCHYHIILIVSHSNNPHSLWTSLRWHFFPTYDDLSWIITSLFKIIIILSLSYNHRKWYDYHYHYKSLSLKIQIIII